MYQVLYRKWRPQVFTDVYGQEHITETLMNAVDTGRVSHAYLFTGSRGTGKTTCAKILAKAVNCEHPVNGNPCNECASCRGIDDGSVVDVVEIDAASNNGVDNIRDLREETNYMPSSVKYRVYIIDEVHMLSTGAFNALLKTLEEPPEHVKFILATTEVHKLPSTILSRCQRFDFKRISPEDISSRLKYVAEQENIDLTDEGAMLIARVSDGGMRDALSLLDRCASYGKKITEELASDAAGIAGKEHIYSLVNAIRDRDCTSALEILNSLYENSCDMERLFSELISHFRNMMITLTVPTYKSLILASDTEAEKIKAQAQSLSLATVLSAMETLNNAIYDLKKGDNKKITAEMVMIKLCSPELVSDNAALLRRISELEAKISSGSITVKAAPEKKAENPFFAHKEPQKAADEAPIIKEEPKPIHETVKTEIPVSQQVEAPKPVSSAASSNEEIKPFLKWSDILDIVQQSDPMIMSFLNNSTAYIKDGCMCIKPTNPILQQFITKKEHSEVILNAIKEVTGQDLKISLVTDAQPVKKEKAPVATSNMSPLDSLFERAKGLDIQIIEQ